MGNVLLVIFIEEQWVGFLFFETGDERYRTADLGSCGVLVIYLDLMSVALCQRHENRHALRNMLRLAVMTGRRVNKKNLSHK